MSIRIGEPPEVGSTREVILGSMVGRLSFLAVLSAVLGVISGLIWHAVVSLPSYTITDQGRAVMSDQGLTKIFAADAWFVMIGLVTGLGLGSATWLLTRTLGWPAALIAVAAGFLAAWVCWRLGVAIGPHDFAERIASAAAGERIPIDFTVRSSQAFLVWPFAALTPVLLYSSLGPESLRDHRSIPMLPQRPLPTVVEQVDLSDPAAGQEQAGNPDRATR